MTKMLFITSLLIMATTAAAQENPCHEFVDDPFSRLSCYDLQTGFAVGGEETESSTSNATTKSDDPVVDTKKWELIEAKDPVRGTNTSRAYLEADDIGSQDAPVIVVLQCNGEGGHDIYVWTEGYLGGDNVRVTYRWGEDEPISERWGGGTSGKSAFLPKGYRDFRNGLEAGGRLAFEWRDFRGARSASVWNNVQLDENAQFILDGCKK